MTDVLYDKNDVGRNEKLLQSMRPGTGRRIKEDFSVVNVADLFDYDEEGNLFLRVTLIGGGGSSPLTTKGDIYAHNATVDARLPVGVNGQVLSADSAEATGLKWINPIDVGAIWGSITGTLGNQTDLALALGAKADASVISSLVPYSGATGSVNLGAYNLTATNIYGATAIQANKLGTATAINPLYNSADHIWEASAWDTDGAVEETWKFKWRIVPISGTTTSGWFRLYAQKDNGGEVNVFTISSQGVATISNSLSVPGLAVSGSSGINCNVLYPYNSTFLTLKGRAVTSSIAQAIKIGSYTATQTPTMGHQLLSYYTGNIENQIGGVDALDGFSFQRTGFKQTTDGSQQAITGTGAVLTTSTDQVYQVRAMVVGKQSDTNVAGVEIVATIRNVDGVASIVGVVQQVAPNQSAGDWGNAGTFATFTISGADVRVSVQGKAGTIIDWRMAMDYITY